MMKNGFLDKAHRNFLVIALHLLTANNLYSQDSYTGSIAFDKNGSSFDICVIYEKIEIKTFPNVNYHWYRNGDLKSTLGGYSGNVLHGKYEKFDSLGNLRSKGDFAYGVKDGEWKYWNGLGVIDVEEIWKDGFLQERIFFKEGITTTQSFKNNLLHGKVTERKGDETISSLKYQNGKLKPEKESRLFVRLRSLLKNNKVDDSEKLHTTFLEN